MRTLLALLALLLLPAPALAAATVYTGSLVVPVGGTITQASGGTGCVVATAGLYGIGICPTGTASFIAGTNITITGSNPYTINCPLCFQTTGGTITGATIFSNTTTFNGLLTSSVGITNSSATVPVTSGASAAYSKGFAIGNGAGTFSYLGTTASSLGTCSVAGTGLALTVGTTLTSAIDASGNLCTIGTIYYTSARYTKSNIRSADMHGLDVVRSVNANLAWNYKAQYGNPTQTRYGPMADDLPAYISGPNHSRIDLEAAIWTQWDALRSLDAEVQWLRLAVGALVVWCLVLSCFMVRRAKMD
jgi:hypothetical protein